MTATFQVNVGVEDFNDNPPLFAQDVLAYVLSETSLPPLVIDEVLASDADTGENAVVSYAIVSGNDNGLFELDSENGTLILIGRLDFESQEMYSLTLTATNSLATPSLVSTATVQITVVESNEFPPMFSQIEYEASIMENVAASSSVLQLAVSDQDGGVSGDITLSISQGNSLGRFRQSRLNLWITKMCQNTCSQ